MLEICGVLKFQFFWPRNSLLKPDQVSESCGKLNKWFWN